MLEADEAFFKEHGEPLFSSHMLDLSAALCLQAAGLKAMAGRLRSEEPDEENIAICAKLPAGEGQGCWTASGLLQGEHACHHVPPGT